jgi:hypothetical protein
MNAGKAKAEMNAQRWFLRRNPPLLRFGAARRDFNLVLLEGAP